HHSHRADGRRVPHFFQPFPVAHLNQEATCSSKNTIRARGDRNCPLASFLASAAHKANESVPPVKAVRVRTPAVPTTAASTPTKTAIRSLNLALAISLVRSGHDKF